MRPVRASATPAPPVRAAGPGSSGCHLLFGALLVAVVAGGALRGVLHYDEWAYYLPALDFVVQLDAPAPDRLPIPGPPAALVMQAWVYELAGRSPRGRARLQPGRAGRAGTHAPRPLPQRAPGKPGVAGRSLAILAFPFLLYGSFHMKHLAWVMAGLVWADMAWERLEDGVRPGRSPRARPAAGWRCSRASSPRPGCSSRRSGRPSRRANSRWATRAARLRSRSFRWRARRPSCSSGTGYSRRGIGSSCSRVSVGTLHMAPLQAGDRPLLDRRLGDPDPRPLSSGAVPRRRAVPTLRRCSHGSRGAPTCGRACSRRRLGPSSTCCAGPAAGRPIVLAALLAFPLATGLVTLGRLLLTPGRWRFGGLFAMAYLAMMCLVPYPFESYYTIACRGALRLDG